MAVIQKEDFPYIQALEVHDCYAYQDLKIVVNSDEKVTFRHLILTGKNGSGKTTILKFLYENLDRIVNQNLNVFSEIKKRKEMVQSPTNEGHSSFEAWKKIITEWETVLPIFKTSISYFTKEKKHNILLTKFDARRTTTLAEVKTGTKGNEVSKLLNGNTKPEDFRKQLKQHLVNKKISQAFAQIKGDVDTVKSIEYFFNSFTEILKKIFDNKKLLLTFNAEEYEFYIKLEKNHTITFNQMSDGFSAFINIILDLIVRVELIRETVKDNSYNPCGFVLIDEPETHLHLELQYQVLPLLTTIFPNIQFIVATHSPAVISSIKNATIYDLSTQKTVADWVVGSSYSELMMTHFGLENEFSNVADEIMETTQALVENPALNPEEKHQKLKKIFEENEKYLSPSLRLALEVQVLKLERQLAIK